MTHAVEGWLNRNDQGKLYILSRGQGLPVIFCNGLGVAADSFWSAICQPLARHCRPINWDYQAHGRSAPPPEDKSLSLSLCVDDLFEVMSFLQVKGAVLAGHSMGVQVILEFARRYPDHVLGLIPILGTYEHPLNNFMNWRHSARIFREVAQAFFRFPTMTQVWPHFFTSSFAQPFARFTGLVHADLCGYHDLEIYLAHLRQISPRRFFELALSMQEHSAADFLPQIRVPTLIFAGEDDLFTPPGASEFMARRIPKAELQTIAKGSHAAIAEQPDLFWLRIYHFLQKHFPHELAAPASSPPVASQSS